MLQVFRRHQKRLLAALTIFAMIAFAFPLGTTYFGGSGGGRTRSEPEVVETIFKHRVTSEDVTRARFERHIANTFFQVMVTAVQPELAMRGIGEAFGPTRDDESIRDAIRLSYKADQLGVRVSDDMVRSWINRYTGGKLTNEKFDRVLATVGRVAPQLTGDGGMSAEVMFEILKSQLRIQGVQELVMGRFGDGPMPITPYESWQYYRKLNDKLGLEVIPVRVVDYALQIDDPGDAALRELYNQSITQLPNPASPDPGFKQPRRVSLQYVSVSLGDFTLAMRPELEVTDEEIKEYYDSHKDLYRIKPAAPTLAPTLPPPGVPTKPSDETAPDKKDEPDATKDPEAKPPETDEKKSDPKPAPPDNPSDDETDNLNPEPQADQEPDISAQDSNAAEKKDQDKSDQTEPKQAEPKEADEKKDSDQKKEDDKKQDESQDDEKKEDEKKEDPNQYKPIEEVTDEIREILIKDKARAEITKRLGQIDAKVGEYARVFLRAKDKFDEENAERAASDEKTQSNANGQFVPPEAPDFVALANELGLKLSETGLIALDDEQFKLSGLGQAMKIEGGRGIRNASDVFGSTEYFEPHQFQNFVSDEYYTAWKTDDKPEREPQFEEIRDRVLLAYRLIHARDRAEQHANKLADTLRDVQGDMEKFREKEGGVESITIAPMTMWSNAFSLQMMSRPGRKPTDLPGLHLPSDEMRNKTFELREGEVTVGPNQPKDIYYVVLLAKRELASREDFARSRQFIEMQIQSELAEKMYRDWLADLRREASGKVAQAPAGN